MRSPTTVVVGGPLVASSRYPRGEVMQFQHFTFGWHTLQVTEPAQSALHQGLFMAPAALPIREVISASMEPSAETIEPRYVNEGTNSTSSPSMFIGMVIAEDGEIIMALFLVQLIDIPTLPASLLLLIFSPIRLYTS